MAAHNFSEKQEEFHLSFAKDRYVFRRFGPGLPQSCPTIEQIARSITWIVLAGPIPVIDEKRKISSASIINYFFLFYSTEKD